MDYLAPAAQSLPIITDDAIRPTSTISCARQLRGFQTSFGTNVRGGLLSSLHLGSFFPLREHFQLMAHLSFRRITLSAKRRVWSPHTCSLHVVVRSLSQSIPPHYSTPCFHCLFRKYCTSSSEWWSLQSGRIRS